MDANPNVLQSKTAGNEELGGSSRDKAMSSLSPNRCDHQSDNVLLAVSRQLLDHLEPEKMEFSDSIVLMVARRFGTLCNVRLQSRPIVEAQDIEILDQPKLRLRDIVS